MCLIVCTDVGQFDLHDLNDAIGQFGLGPVAQIDEGSSLDVAQGVVRRLDLLVVDFLVERGVVGANLVDRLSERLALLRLEDVRADARVAVQTVQVGLELIIRACDRLVSMLWARSSSD